MNNKAGKFVIIIFSLLFLCTISKGQNFKKEILIDIPGDNYDVDTSPGDWFYNNSKKSFITWINKKDSIYTVYLKQISPTIGENIVVASDKNVKSNPQVEFMLYTFPFRIVWQTYADSIWKIETVDYSNDTLSAVTTLVDSLVNDPQISLNDKSLVWIDDGKLFQKKFNSTSEEIVLVDSNYCSNPNIAWKICYEKTIDGERNIYVADYYGIEKISDGNYDSNPQSSYYAGVVFESFQNGLWQLISTFNNGSTFKTFRGETCNYKNPVLFTYPIPTLEGAMWTPFFISLDSDSIPNNKEIMLKYLDYYDLSDSLFNISNLEGDDTHPTLAMVYVNDTPYVSIIWEHRFNNKTDLWIAKDKFKPIIGDVETENKLPEQFSLSQNYPNPFNPETTIEYTIPNVETLHATSLHVTLKVYDILGREVATLVNRYQSPGKYSVQFNVAQISNLRHSLSSGIYFYQLKYGSFIQTKKMVLVK